MFLVANRMSQELREKLADEAKERENDDNAVNVVQYENVLIYMWVPNDKMAVLRKIARYLKDGWKLNGGLQSRWSSGQIIYTATMTK